jgi:hypothetical protein
MDNDNFDEGEDMNDALVFQNTENQNPPKLLNFNKSG